MTKVQIDAVLGIVKKYERRKRDLNKMDCDDLLLGFDRLLDVPRVQGYVQEHYPNVFVDEYCMVMQKISLTRKRRPAGISRKVPSLSFAAVRPPL